MNPVTRGTEVLLTSIETDGEHGLAHTGPNIIGLVLALGHERLLGCCQSHARRREEEHSAWHRDARPRGVSCLHAGCDPVNNTRSRRVAAVACGHSVGGQPSQATIGHAHVDSVEP